LLGRHKDLDLRKREGQKTQFLPPPAPDRAGIRGGLGNPPVMKAASEGFAEEEDVAQGMD